MPQAVANAPMGEPKLTLDPSTPGNPCNSVIGLIDTQVQPLGNGLDQFLESPISVVGNVAPVTGTITHGTAMAQTILAALAAQPTGAPTTGRQAIDGLTAVGPATGAHTSVRILPVNV